VTPLITVAQLAGLLAAGEAPALLDVRYRLGGPPGIESYAAGHLPGAVYVDIGRDLAAPPGAGGRHPMPAADAFQAAMRRAGVREGRLAVVYDDADSMAAARAWWLLRYFGHEQVRVLDGGFRAWTQAGQLSEAGSQPRSPVPAGDFTARPGHMPLLDAAAAAGLARTGLLLDARAGERYRGETEPVDPVAGHIPGAVSAPTTQNLNPDGTFRPPADLAARFAGLGATSTTVTPSATLAPDIASAALATGAYCGSGVTAAHEVLALTLAGIPAALYVGSWSDWLTGPSRPVATGPAPG
jgi:thiosulfate/3-mercaptopyruvate sulfurtransferase